MKTLIVALFMTLAVVSTKSSLGTADARAEVMAENRTGACIYECPTTGVSYRQAAACRAACSSVCEPIC